MMMGPGRAAFPRIAGATCRAGQDDRLPEAHRSAGRERRAEFPGALEIRLLDVLGREDLLRRLGMRTDDDRVGHPPHAPALRDAIDLARRPFAVRARADDGRERATLDAPEHRVIAT